MTTQVHIGIYPPPLGGISVYLYRLSKLQTKDQFIDIRNIFNNKKSVFFWSLKQILNNDKKEFICHSHDLKIRLLLFAVSCVSIHEYSIMFHSIRSLVDQYYSSNYFLKFLIRQMLIKAKRIIVVNPDYKKYIRYFFGIEERNIQVKHAFLPPPIKEENQIMKTYNEDLLSFLKKRDPIIISNAYALVFFNQQDLYGLDMCIKVTQKLKKIYPNIGFLFALANEKKNYDYFKKMKKKINDLNLEKNFYFITGQKEIWPIFKKVDLFIRPTNTDGDSVSIREALHFKCPVIASDIVKRPKNTKIFKTRNLKDLYEKTKKILKD